MVVHHLRPSWDDPPSKLSLEKYGIRKAQPIQGIQGQGGLENCMHFGGVKYMARLHETKTSHTHSIHVLYGIYLYLYSYIYPQNYPNCMVNTPYIDGMGKPCLLTKYEVTLQHPCRLGTDHLEMRLKVPPAKITSGSEPMARLLKNPRESNRIGEI